MVSSNSSFSVSNAQAINLSKPTESISTGIGFFDHMIDQLNSHAQVGVSVHVKNDSDDKIDMDDRNRHSEPFEMQEELMGLVGSALGTEIGKLIPSTASRSRFCCPLDEALVECVLSKADSQEGSGSLESFALAPYGIFPSDTGRLKIGHMMTAPIETFFKRLAETSELSISLIKKRGVNGHHVVESAFKAFSRALRNLIDGTDIDATFDDDKSNMVLLWGINSQSYREGIEMNRSSTSSRATKETSIDVELNLDGGSKGVTVETGVNSLNDFYNELAIQAQMSLTVKCNGDTWVDDHHTSEDVSIAIGKVLNQCLGTKAGLNRMWCGTSKIGNSSVEVTMDLSNRPCLTHNLSLSSCGKEYVGDMSVEMLEHVLDSFVMNAQMTVHIVEKTKGDDVKDLMIATASALGKALRLCASVDPRRAGKTASSKGTLSA